MTADATTLAALQEWRNENCATPTVLHRPSIGPAPRMVSSAASDGAAKPNERKSKAVVELKSAASIKPEAVDWLWPGWLARGKLHVIAGAPGAGKTTIAMSLGATVTLGGDWPDGAHCPSPGRAVIWSGEDDPRDTLVPRLIAAGADLSRVSFVDQVRIDGKTRAFDPATDIEPLREAINRTGGADLLIIDPIVSAVTGDSHKNTEVRRALQPMADLASELRAALIGITHFSKGTAGRNPVERLSGSLAFGALARVVMVAAKKEATEDPANEERLFCRAKSNIGSDSGGFRYSLIQKAIESPEGLQATAVRWGSPIDGTAREILAEAEAVESDIGGGKSEAVAFLETILADGGKSVREIQDAAKANGIAWRTIERAKKDLGVEAAKANFGGRGGWNWHFPQRPPKAATESEQESMAVYGGLCGAKGRDIGDGVSSRPKERGA
jgi:putative DNA primase/helicase